MMIFLEDTKIARSIPARIASYSASLLDVGKSNRMTCSIISPVGALSLQANTSSYLLRSAIHIKDPPVGFTWVRILLGDLC